MSAGKKQRGVGVESLLLLYFVIGPAPAAGQEFKDVPSPDPSPSSLLNLPLDPGRRSSLEQAIKNRKYENAETLLLQEIEQNPKSHQLLTVLGGIFFLDGKYLNTAIALKKAEVLSPLDDQNRFTLAMSYIIINHRDWARPELERLAQSNPRSALYPYWLGRLDYDDMQFAAALDKFKKALELDPSLMKIYDNLGLCYEALGKYDEAIQTYQKATRLNRLRRLNSAWPPLNFGTLLVKLGKLEQAEPYLRESLSYDPKFARAHYQLGILLEKQRKEGEAIQELNQAASLDPSYPEPHYALGRIYQRKGDIRNAETALNTFQKLKKEKRPEREP
jgi:tetratricopeptide (TPR) repeat protein